MYTERNLIMQHKIEINCIMNCLKFKLGVGRSPGDFEGGVRDR